MTGPGCSKTKSGKHRKHTEIVSEKQRRAFAAAEHLPKSKLTGAAKEIRKGTTSAERERHLEEAEGKKLPMKKGSSISRADIQSYVKRYKKKS